MAVQRGTIKSITLDRGFGFIAPEVKPGVASKGGKPRDIFFHLSGLVGVRLEDLKQGDPVSFLVEDSAKGPRAENIQRDGHPYDVGDYDE